MEYFGTSETQVGQAIARWHRQNHAGSMFAAPFGAMAWTGGTEQLTASAVFCNFTGPNIDIHLVIKRPSVRIKRDIYKYVFDDLKCHRLTGVIPLSNVRILRLVKGLGFHLEGGMPYFFGPREEDEGIVFGLYAHDMR